MTKFFIVIDAKEWIQNHPDDNPSRVVLVAHLYPELKDGINVPREFSTHTQIGKGEESFLITGHYCHDLKGALADFLKRES